MKPNIIIRREVEIDYPAVYLLVKEAFEKWKNAQADEQDLVERLRKSKAFVPELSLVAEIEEKIVGHILFTRLTIGRDESLALAPMAVLPGFQRSGIGGKLIEEGHRIARQLGFKSCIVLGHKEYYPRFGYKPASQWGINAPSGLPQDVFMAIELVPGGLQGVHGKVLYAPEFGISG